METPASVNSCVLKVSVFIVFIIWGKEVIGTWNSVKLHIDWATTDSPGSYLHK